MARHNDKDLDTSAGIVKGLFALAGAAAIGSAVSSSNKEKRRKEIDDEIRSLERKNSSLKSGLLGSVLNSSEIEANNRKIAKLENEKRNL